MFLKRALILLLAASLSPGCGVAADRPPIEAELLVVDGAPPAAAGLRFLGAMALRAEDERFGGLSGLVVEGDQVTAVSDHGFLVSFRLREAPDGRLAGATDLSIAPMLDPAGQPLGKTRRRDAEDATRLPNGDLAVVFERNTRIGVFPRGSARMREVWPLVGLVPQTNQAIEAMATLADGRLLLIAERLGGPPGTRRAWLGSPAAWQPLLYRTSGDLDVAGAAVLPGGDLLVLERDFSPLAGFSGRLVRVSGARIQPAAVLNGQVLLDLSAPYPSDNYEGVAVRNDGARSSIFLISDDNFLFLQRTILLKLELPN